MYLPSNVKQVPGIKSASSEGFTFQDDSTAKADALIYCTGRRKVKWNIYRFITGKGIFSKMSGMDLLVLYSVVVPSLSSAVFHKIERVLTIHK